MHAIETYGDNLSPILALFQAKPLTPCLWASKRAGDKLLM